MIFSMVFRIMCTIFVIGPRFVVISRKLCISRVESVFVSIIVPMNAIIKKSVPIVNANAELSHSAVMV